MGSASPLTSHLQHGNLQTSSSTYPTHGSIPLLCGGNAEKPTTKQLNSNAAVTDKARNEVAAREAKLEIRSKVREDWEWPPSSPDILRTTSFSQDAEGIRWRERASDSEACSLRTETDPPSPHHPYGLDTPDTVAQQIIGRKRMRREMLREEMAWNEGLRTFVERRDAWTGARTQDDASENEDVPAALTSPAVPSSPGDTASATTPPSPVYASSATLVPIAPPILPSDNVIRASIIPETYPTLYTKIVLQGLTPTIPVNLSDIVATLVRGWKRDGQWPPKSNDERDGTGTKGRGRRLAKRGVGRFKRVLRFGHGGGEEDELGAEINDPK
ncbi:MAG: hypothetical protein Q9163_000328 [Psora crenata]